MFFIAHEYNLVSEQDDAAKMISFPLLTSPLGLEKS